MPEPMIPLMTIIVASKRVSLRANCIGLFAVGTSLSNCQDFQTKR
jgi:hypothetical protein